MTKLSQGVIHKMPSDLQKVLFAKEKARLAWEAITPLAQNEWICWVEDAKREQTRNRRIERARDEIASGKKRPCCWPGCQHR